MKLFARFFARLVPNMVSVSPFERLRAAVGAFVGILATAGVTALALGHGLEFPLLMAPIGASAVLLFAVPSSPLAQPWSILAGNCLAALVGISCAQLMGPTPVAAALAVSVSIGLMLTFKCLHPPSGAVALTAVVGGPVIADLGYAFVVWPVGINSVLLLLAALLFNRLTGKQYPHKPAPSAAMDAKVLPFSPQVSLGISVDDLRSAMRERDEVLSVDPADIEDVLERAALVAFSRRSGGITAGMVMSRDVARVQPGTSLRVALRTLRSQGVKALPVVDGANQVVGILTQTDLLEKAEWGPVHASSGLGWRLRALSNSDRPLRGKVRDVMTTNVSTVAEPMPIALVMRLMQHSGHHHIPVASDDGRLVGMVTQSDLIGALLGSASEDLARIA
ncbi:CBS domain-containing membrane protein [Devosia lucknowensis]|uniref:CBS domain-containing membrane protein n=1 Tax=Devosia lucknowensis TaxID=1096929 RepID=A0A1Y6EGW3_9HYPH|nr:HPP family protein [Devosia lucknowensis]SMQ61855.1 CBS domain-containing membrane protein [Devosia lucknowensis]